MLQIASSQPEVASDVEDDEDEPQPSTSSGITHGSKTSSSRPPPAKKARAPPAAGSAGLADTLRDFLHKTDSEAKEVRTEVDIHAFGTEIA